MLHVDWLTARQEHPEAPDFGSVLRVDFDPDGAVQVERMIGEDVRLSLAASAPASRSSHLRVRSWRGTVEVSGNPSKWGRVEAGVEAVGVAELRPDGQKTIWGSWGMRVAFVGLFAVVGIGLYIRAQGGAFFVASAPASASVHVQDLPRQAPVPVATPGGAAGGELARPPAPPPEVERSPWRLAAWIGPRPDRTFAVVATDGRTKRALGSAVCDLGFAGEWGCWVDGRWATVATGSGLTIGEVVDPEGARPVEPDYVAIAKARQKAGIPVGLHADLIEGARP